MDGRDHRFLNVNWILVKVKIEVVIKSNWISLWGAEIALVMAFRVPYEIKLKRSYGYFFEVNKNSRKTIDYEQNREKRSMYREK